MLRDKKYKFLEVNPRTWKWHTVSEKSDSSFLMSLYNLTYNRKLILRSDWRNAGFKHLVTDLPITLRLILQGEFKRSKVKNIQYAVWNKEDLKPAVFELLYLPYSIIMR